DDLHFNLGVKLLNDKFGIQTRGGCSCAGTYGHFLLNVNQETSSNLIYQIETGDLTQKPGWIRMSIHPTTTNKEIEMVCDSIIDLALNHDSWKKDYSYNKLTNEFTHNSNLKTEKQLVDSWFN
ncbi:MAG: selenocysteine lyase, partial [Flavobacterium sp.]|nr:selenocysteine lyase [Flavobacterium sp.]